MNDFGPYYLGDSAEGYDRMRRRRQRAMGPRQLQSYASFLLGVDSASGSPDIVAAETAAFSDTGSSVLRPILIGVATGALTFLINRWLEKALR